MDHHLGNVVRHLVIEPGHHFFKVTHVFRTSLPEPIAPAANLPLHVTGALTQLVQACGPGIHGMQVYQLVDHVQAQLAGVFSAQLEILGEILAQNDALEPFHHVEVTAQNAVIVADGDNIGHVGIRRLQGLHHASFPQHVVGRLGDLAERWPAQHV